MDYKHTPKKPAPGDWHNADIVAALHKRGWTVRGLSRHHGYKSGNQLTVAIARPWPKGERLIADAIGVPPETIWATRYAKRSARRGS